MEAQGREELKQTRAPRRRQHESWWCQSECDAMLSILFPLNAAAHGTQHQALSDSPPPSTPGENWRDFSSIFFLLLFINQLLLYISTRGKRKYDKKNSKQSYLTSISDLRCCSCSCRWRERSRYSPRSFSISRLSWSTSVSLSRSREVRSWCREYEGPKASVLPPRVRSGRSPVEPMAMW